eukprot:CAMPEP_0174868710 /NCGR_PEP_ID=MMETSP1114-20130205/66506_1 /TAXON_ID=312471 /ORGANISM="Neobodo designis, Strain CCAP 1951/1" /LENGTH=47 /DNA_ID= /DNA_START= /DNA_END= /DNA_ORIENTATION=
MCGMAAGCASATPLIAVSVCAASIGVVTPWMSAVMYWRRTLLSPSAN